LLEPLLARQRAKMANQLISPELREGRILDIGCGSFPYFLSNTAFKEKVAVDQLAPGLAVSEIEWHILDLNLTPTLPFDKDHFTVVTLLAVIEHLDPTHIVSLFKEIHRVLRMDGCVILTTPAPRSDELLKWMGKIGLVSKEEIDEHVFVYSHSLIGWCFGAAGFSMSAVQFGAFEFGFNLWAKARKVSPNVLSPALET
jgi:SAM-dependent methyltransferase